MARRVVLVGNGPSSWWMDENGGDWPRALVESGVDLVVMNMRQIPATHVCIHDKPEVDKRLKISESTPILCFRKHFDDSNARVQGREVIYLDDRLDGSCCGRTAVHWAANAGYDQIDLVGFDGTLDPRTVAESKGGRRSQHKNWFNIMIEDARGYRSKCSPRFRIVLPAARDGSKHPLEALPAERVSVEDFKSEIPVLGRSTG